MIFVLGIWGAVLWFPLPFKGETLIAAIYRFANLAGYESREVALGTLC